MGGVQPTRARDTHSLQESEDDHGSQALASAVCTSSAQPGRFPGPIFFCSCLQLAWPSRHLCLFVARWAWFLARPHPRALPLSSLTRTLQLAFEGRFRAPRTAASSRLGLGRWVLSPIAIDVGLR